MRLNTDSATTDRNIFLSQPTGTWLIHNTTVILNTSCKWCGDDNHHAYIDGACWKCWRNRHPGALQ